VKPHFVIFVHPTSVTIVFYVLLKNPIDVSVIEQSASFPGKYFGVTRSLITIRWVLVQKKLVDRNKLKNPISQWRSARSDIGD